MTVMRSRGGFASIPLATSFRSAYAYDNVLYLVAGEVIETISGQSWEDFMAPRILKKVGMTGSTVRHSDATRGGNVAAPHASVDGRVRPIQPFDSDNTNPAGGINSNAEDMAKWMITLLDRGQLPDGSRLFSERDVRSGHHARDPDADRRSSAGTGRAPRQFPRLRARSRRARLSRSEGL